MCGVAGCIVPPGETPDRGVLERMATALGHRGPDDRGIEVVGTVGLVHTRLSIVDPSPAGHQPMAHPNGRWWLTYNGEVFNHLSLRQELPRIDYRGGSDTETLLNALATWGEAAIPRCNGLFAYAALDLDRRRLLLVRDRFGVKPLYLAWRDGELWFASEIRALLEAGIERRPRTDLLRHALAFGWINGPLTPLAGVSRLLPGTVLEVDLDTRRAVERRWYDPADAVDRERAAALEQLGPEQLRSELEESLRTSVRRRLMADVPVGTMCSGGLDSSLVTALARDEHPDIHAFNAAVVDQPEKDEGPWAKRVADALEVELHTVRMTGESWRARLVEVVCHNEYPLIHVSSVPMSEIAKLARDDGVKVLLSGEGADELFGGYDQLHTTEYHDFERRHEPLQRAARPAYRWLQRRGIASSPQDPRGSPPPDVAAYERAVEQRALRAYRHHRWTRGRLEAALLGDLATYLPHLLNRQDKNTMQRSIETRVPFLDPDVVALALNLPLEARIEPRRKSILREIAKHHLPADVIDRPKIGFGFRVDDYIKPAARAGFLTDGILRELFEVPAGAWKETVGRLRANRVLRFWSGEIWCRAFLDGQPVAAIESDLWNGGP